MEPKKMTNATQNRPEKSTATQYTIEADHPRNSDLLLQGIVGMRLRSRIMSSRQVIANPQSPDRPVPRDQARHLGSLPTIPGMRLTVDVNGKRYRVDDPLHENKELGESIKRGMQADGRPIPSNARIEGTAPQSGKLDADRFKTLCREIRWLIDAGEAREVDGPFMSMKEIDALPGDYLLNPGGRVNNSQPRYEKDLEAWERQLNSTERG